MTCMATRWLLIEKLAEKKRPILSNEASLLVVKEGLEPSTPGL